MQQPENDVYTVSRLNGEVRRLLEGQLGRVWLSAEISNFSAPSSGHWYLTLKDSQSQIRAAMFKGRNATVTFRPANGQQVLVRGSISVYEPRGDYQLLIDAMFPAGDGMLAARFEALKMKLAAEGLFALETKRPLPTAIHRIGVITSPTGAAIRDVLHVLKRRNPAIEVIIYPTPVQGNDADKEIIRAIELANQRLEVDVLLLTRGGGSLEDLWCFNSEALAHAIYNSALTVVSAVGHEVDTSIADYVADVRAPTPSAGAELLSDDQSHRLHKLLAAQGRLAQSWRHYSLQQGSRLAALHARLERHEPKRRLTQQIQKLDELELRLTTAIERRFARGNLRLVRLAAQLESRSPASTLRLVSARLGYLDDRLKSAMDEQLKAAKTALEHHQGKLGSHSPMHRLALQRQQLNYLDERLKNAMADKVHDAKNGLGQLAHSLGSVSPLATLSRGYAITKDEQGQVITDATSLNVGDRVSTTLKQGSFVARVLEIVPTTPAS